MATAPSIRPSLKGGAYRARLSSAGGGGRVVAPCSSGSIIDVAAEIKGAGGAVIVISKTSDDVSIEG